VQLRDRNDVGELPQLDLEEPIEEHCAAGRSNVCQEGLAGAMPRLSSDQRLGNEARVEHEFARRNERRLEVEDAPAGWRPAEGRHRYLRTARRKSIWTEARTRLVARLIASARSEFGTFASTVRAAFSSLLSLVTRPV